MSARTDAIVIGGGVGGLVAAIALKRAGSSVVLLEAHETLNGGLPPYLFALDPRVVRELGLSARGLKFAERDLASTALRQDGRHLTLARDPHAAARAIAAHSPTDAGAYARFHDEIFALARALRPFWWEDAAAPRPSALLARLRMTSAAAYLNQWFESDALKALLSFDVPFPHAPGSALALVWRAAQEMCGLQGALAVPAGGGLGAKLVAMAQELRVDLRAKARVAKLILAGDEAAGVELDSGEKIFAAKVFSSLGRRETLLTLAPTASAGFAQTLRLMRDTPRARETVLRFTLNAAPGFANGRQVIVEGEPALEAVVAPAPQAGQHQLWVRAKGEAEADAVTAQLERFAPQLKSRIVATERHTRDVLVPHLMDEAAIRIMTPIRHLYLCGGDAEPMDAVAGRAARLAAALATRDKGA
ncbi:MAG: NAD(P)/FAD-dependent oxidoreductase [Alphaproteobacteria bacterium]|nr:NAD(P)/FAD-dependent oxidoreductase [Alphaproteobacteria bacterium]